jgi:hypothetical protein
MFLFRGRSGRDRIVVGFITTYATDLALIYCMLSGNMTMVFNALFNNISAISWRSALMLEEIGVPGENHLTYRKSLTNFIT